MTDKKQYPGAENAVKSALVVGHDGSVHEAGKPVFFYNIVFTHLDGSRITRTAFCSVKLDVPIEYGSDLQALREYLAQQLPLRELVIVSWKRMVDAHRPGGAVPLIEVMA